MGSRNWKQGLLSSGLPLEYEVNKFFKNKNSKCRLFSEYPYTRMHLNEVKEFSVDLLCEYPIDGQRGEGFVKICYLIECKYLSQGKKWLFLPFIGGTSFKDFFVPINSINCFENEPLSRNNTLSNFSKQIQNVYKGIEYHKHTNEFFEKNLMRGISQLQYAIPNYIFENTRFYLEIYLERLNNKYTINYTELICPILITNAELRVMDYNLDIEMIENSKDLNEISRPVEFMYYNFAESRYYDNYVFEAKNSFLESEISRINNQNRKLDRKIVENIYERLYNELSLNSILICNIASIDKLTNMVEEAGLEIGLSKWKF